MKRLALFAAALGAGIWLEPTNELYWIFAGESASGPDGLAPKDSELRFAPVELGGGLLLNRMNDAITIAGSAAIVRDRLPKSSLSVSAWVAIERPQRWGGIVSCIQDNGDYEKGFVLGYDEERFTFGLSTSGADDGDGKLTYLRGKTPFIAGRWHHVAATFDGTKMCLYVDGELDAESGEQSGSILYDDHTPLVLGAYVDANESYAHDGRLLEVRLADTADSANDIRSAFASRHELTELAAWTDMEFGFLVPPYLTWPAKDGVSILFETAFPSSATIAVRADDESKETHHELADSRALHELRLTGLRPNQKYFYRVTARSETGEEVQSPQLSFRTAATPDHAFTFVAIGDTQTNGTVAKRVSDLAYMHRPNLVVHAGDLVDSGRAKRDWTDTFFPSMQPLISRTPLMPVLGNHEQDAPHYYDYMSLPAPERWYSFEYGNAEFFMIDGNRSLDDQSAQLEWLEEALADSKALWRFAVLHQPPYTSDSNDYGDTSTTTSTRGDMNVRNIVRALERHGVDICFSGHVHDYERTFPILEGRVTPYEDGGVIYVTAAGGGGPLEDFDPANTWFGHKKARYHHLVYVAVHGAHLEFQAIDENGRLFDSMTLRKRD